MNLSDEQIQIVNHKTGNAVVVAGAGSGKTRCLIERTSKLIKDGVSPNKILIFTFTKKAANEIKSRLIKSLGEDVADQITASTIHSLAIKIIRENSDVLGYANPPTIWTSDKVTRLSGTIFSDQINEQADIETIQKTISEIEKSIKEEKQEKPSGLFPRQPIKDLELESAINLHKMKMRVSTLIGDPLRNKITSLNMPSSKTLEEGKEEEKEEEKENDAVILPAEVLSEVNKLSHGQKSVYLSLDFDCSNLVRKGISKLKKDFVKMIQSEMRPIPEQISGIKPKERRRILSEKLQSKGEWTFAINSAMKLLHLKQSCSAIEFDDMVPGACRVLNLDPDNPYKTMFHHVMVDEYQDVNNENVAFIKLLSENSISLMAVGDDDQAIYGFRGGNTEHILKFPERFNASIYYLTKNYRCTETIVKSANKLIKINKNRFDKTMTASKKEKPGDSQYVLKKISPLNSIWNYKEQPKYEAYGSLAEFKYEMFEEIYNDLRAEIFFMETPASNIAILSRNNFQLTQFNIWSKRHQMSRPLKDRIKFQNLSDVSIFNNKITDKIHNWFNYIVNPKDFVSLRDALMATVKGFGDTTALHLMDAATSNPDGGLEYWFDYVLRKKRHGRHTSIGKKIVGILDMYNNIKKDISNKRVYDIFLEIIPHIGLDKEVWQDYKKDIEEDNFDGNYATPDKKEKSAVREADNAFNEKLILYEYDAAIQVLTGLIGEDSLVIGGDDDSLEDPFDDPFYVPEPEPEENEEVKTEIRREKFFGAIGILNWMDEVRTESEVDLKKEGVILGTIHSSKGKEWQSVYIIGLIEGVMPSSRNEDNEEERRLMYVGMTRAEEKLTLCWDTEGKKSSFIHDIFSENKALPSPRGFEDKNPDKDSKTRSYIKQI